MKHHMILTLCAAGALCQTVGSAQIVIGPDSHRPRFGVRAQRGVHLFLGTPGARGRIEVFDEFSGRRTATPVDLRDLRLLPIDFVGRTELEAFLPDRPRHFADVAGGARLALPAGSGQLYHYERTIPGGHVFGYLHLRVDGSSRTLAETPGLGAAGDADPFLDRIAVGAAGEAILVATLPAAGGNLIEVDLTHGISIDRTPHLPPLAIAPAGMWLNDAFGFAVAADGIHRYERIFFAQTTLVPFAPGEQPTWFSGEAVVSANREWAITTAGAGSTLQHAFVFGASGPALRASQAPETLSPAGFLPEHMHGPYHAVSNDGQSAAWRREPVVVTEDREIYLAECGPQAPPPVQITDDPFFVDTLDEIGLLRFNGPSALNMAVGELDAVTGEIEKIDLFEATLIAGAPSFVNLSLTNGTQTVPFPTPLIKPLNLHFIPSTGSYLLHDENANQLLGVDPDQPGVFVLMDEVKDVRFVEPTGDHFLIAVRRDFGSRPDQLTSVRRSLTAPAAILDPGSDDTEFLTPTSRGAGWAGYVKLIGVAQSMHRVHVPTATIETFPGGATSFVAPIGNSELDGQIVASGSAQTTFEVWYQSGARTALQAGPGPGHVVPAR